MAKQIIIFFLQFLLLLPAYSQEYEDNIDMQKVEWLIGTWVQETKKGAVYESWSLQNDSALLGRSYKINQQDTIIFETIRLVHESGKLYYVPVVSNQNQGKPVRFALVKLTDTEMVFTNPAHDFPQIIQYKQQGKDALLAEIRGTNKGVERTVQFPMKRVSTIAK